MEMYANIVTNLCQCQVNGPHSGLCVRRGNYSRFVLGLIYVFPCSGVVDRSHMRHGLYRTRSLAFRCDSVNAVAARNVSISYHHWGEMMYFSSPRVWNRSPFMCIIDRYPEYQHRARWCWSQSRMSCDHTCSSNRNPIASFNRRLLDTGY